MNYYKTIEYIHSVSWKGSRPGLERISELCAKLGHPEDSLRFIHVAGTNGKGSVCRMLSCILEDAGYRTGLFTSPFVEDFNERIMFNGENITNEELAEVTSYVRQFADKMDDSPTEFELITAVALEYYKRKRCNFVVFECGLGGRLDSTNIINTPVLSIITGIDLDHTALLGGTTAEIAREKAGIIKNGSPVLFGEGNSDAERVVHEVAAERGSEFCKTDFLEISNIKTDLDSTSFDFGGSHVNIRLHGLYQTRNAATVLTAVDILRKQGIIIGDGAIYSGLGRAEWKARFEILSRDPLVIYDGAHNPQGISGAVENIRQYLSPLTADGQIVVLMGVMADKDHEKMIKMLAPLTAYAVTVMPHNARSLDSGEVEREFELYGVAGKSFTDVNDGVAAAVDEALRTKRPLIALGSLYMYADVKRAVKSCVFE